MVFSPLNKTSVAVNRYSIKIDESKPTADLGVKSVGLFMQAGIEDARSILINQHMIPNLDKAQTSPTVVKQINFSPSGWLQKNEKCILAAITTNGQLTLYGYVFNEWSNILDVSNIWVNHCQASWHKPSKQIKHQLSELTYRINRVKLTAMKWSKMIVDTNSGERGCWLITAAQDGIVAFWKVFDTSEQKGFVHKHTSKVTTSIIANYDSGMGHVTSLHWYPEDSNTGYLIVGNNAGVLKCMKISIDIKSETRNIVSSNSVTLWEFDDKIQISTIECWLLDDDSFISAAVKGSFIIFSRVDKKCTVVSSAAHSTNMQFITGLQQLDATSVLITSKTRQFTVLKLSFHKSQIIVNEIPLENELSNQRHSLMGIALSRNKAIGCAVMSVSGYYDHLILREVANIDFFSLSESTDPLEQVLKSNYRLDKLWDYLELIRWQIVNKKVNYSLPSNIEENLDTMNLKQLCIYMWLSKFLMYSSQLDEEDSEYSTKVKVNNKMPFFTNMHKKLETLVFSNHVFQRCADLCSDGFTMTEFDKESLALIWKWLAVLPNVFSPDLHKTLLSTALTWSKKIEKVVKVNNFALPEVEHCLICDEGITAITDFKMACCKKNHKIIRCSLSLVQCPFDQMYNCSRCRNVVHRLAVSEDRATCIFCDSPLGISKLLLDDDEL